MKERVVDFAWNSLSRGIGLAICVALIYAATGIINQVPCWLGAWFPAVVTHASWAAYRDGAGEGHGAFILANEKIAPGDPLFPEFRAAGRNGAFSPALGLSVHRCQDDNSRIDGPLPKHPVGQKWQTRYCFDMPGTFSATDELTITGHLVHRRWFGVLHEPVPSFTMCPVGMTLVRSADGDRCEFHP